ncbi:MAG: hypothetical protein RR606_06885 [Oscillospiraceae bacterium]
MFLAENARRGKGVPPGTALGPVTLEGNAVAAYLEGERRNLPVFSPGGYRWAPAVSQNVLVLGTEDEGGTPCVVGVQQGDTPALAPGEVRISSAGGAAISFNNSGVVRLTGNIIANGEVLLTKSVVQQMIADAIAANSGKGV